MNVCKDLIYILCITLLSVGHYYLFPIFARRKHESCLRFLSHSDQTSSLVPLTCRKGEKWCGPSGESAKPRHRVTVGMAR